jgi:hypothetical protein
VCLLPLRAPPPQPIAPPTHAPFDKIIVRPLHHIGRRTRWLASRSAWAGLVVVLLHCCPYIAPGASTRTLCYQKRAWARARRAPRQVRSGRPARWSAAARAAARACGCNGQHACDPVRHACTPCSPLGKTVPPCSLCAHDASSQFLARRAAGPRSRRLRYRPHPLRASTPAYSAAPAAVQPAREPRRRREAPWHQQPMPGEPVELSSSRSSPIQRSASTTCFLKTESPSRRRGQERAASAAARRWQRPTARLRAAAVAAAAAHEAAVLIREGSVALHESGSVYLQRT